MKHTLFSFVLLSWPLAAGASPNPWPFDFDSQISPYQDYIDQRIEELSAGLPGVPPTPMAEVELGDVRLYFYQEMADAFFRARDSGPGFADPLPRDPLMCRHHADFVAPDLTLVSNTPACNDAKARIESALADHARACLQVEFPEIYVLEYEAGPIPPSTLTSFEGLISLCGEALMHVDFQQNLFAPELVTVMREVIAKLRYETLLADIDSQWLACQDVLDSLEANPSCFVPDEANDLTAAIDAMSSELDAAEQWLVALYQNGLDQAARDLADLEARGRTRDALLHPALSDHERLMLSFYIGGIYWRMRGAGLVAEPPDPEDGLLRRLYFVKYPFQLIGELNAGVDDAENVGLDIFVQENWGYADWMDMGTSPGRDKYADLVDMTGRGREATTLVAPLLGNRGYDVRELIFGGLMMGPCYYYAWEELRDYQLGPDLEYPYMWFLECPTAIGEFCTGGTLALGLARTLLWGKPGEACEPDCTGKECGEDGCGGTCGACGPDEVCTDGLCQSCTPDCTGKECGDDGCGGSCGVCAEGELCRQGECVCAPDCSGKECGDDGCGGSCGTCVGGDVCQQGLCVCVPGCAGRECGDDGCGGSCGNCPEGSVCQEGTCVSTKTDAGTDAGEDGGMDAGADGACPSRDDDDATPAGDGCGCRKTGGAGHALPFLALFALVAVTRFRR